MLDFMKCLTFPLKFSELVQATFRLNLVSIALQKGFLVSALARGPLTHQPAKPFRAVAEHTPPLLKSLQKQMAGRGCTGPWGQLGTL